MQSKDKQKKNYFSTISFRPRPVFISKLTPSKAQIFFTMNPYMTELARSNGKIGPWSQINLGVKSVIIAITSPKYFLCPHYEIQGDPNQNLKFVFVITLKLFISDPMLVKPNCVSDLTFFSISKKNLNFSAVCLQFFKKN